MRTLSYLPLIAAAFTLAAYAEGLSADTPPTPAPAASPAQALRQIFADSDEASLKLSPISALFRGDQRYANQFGDYITDDFIAQSRHDADEDMRRLHTVDRSVLNPQDQLAYDVFEYQTRQAQEGLSPELVALTVVRPLDHMNGLHIQYPDMSSGKSVARFQTVEDYENGLKRIDGFVVFLDRCIERLREGMKTHVVQTRLTVSKMIPQLEELIAQGVEKSPFWQPIAIMPEAIPAADRARFTDAYRKAIETKIIPADKRLLAFLKKEYLAVARPTVGLSGMKGGARLYAYLIETQTTTKLTADEIHKMGLGEVTRIKGEMDSVRKAVGFKGSLHDFFQRMRTAKEFEPKTAKDIENGYSSIKARILAAVPQDFSLIPKSPLEVRPVPKYLEQSQAGGYYNPGTPDGSRPGVFYFNTYDLPSRKEWGMETLFLHEAIPGHHFQISLAQENTDLPNFMRFGGNTAYVEGWALYAEWLGRELGMYKDPYQMFGHLNDEQLRALRLVVDTGLHAKGWSREKAIKFMLDNSALSTTETTQEVDRYIANPGQALGYKVGQLTIKRLRREAEQAMGSRFSAKDFHAQVLNTGALPMEILEAKIHRWMAPTH